MSSLVGLIGVLDMIKPKRRTTQVIGNRETALLEYKLIMTTFSGGMEKLLIS
jgi:hypothetical protein